MWVCLCLCVCVYVYACVYTCMSVCMLYMSVYACVYSCMSVSVLMYKGRGPYSQTSILHFKISILKISNYHQVWVFCQP